MVVVLVVVVVVMVVVSLVVVASVVVVVVVVVLVVVVVVGSRLVACRPPRSRPAPPSLGVVVQSTPRMHAYVHACMCAHALRARARSPPRPFVARVGKGIKVVVVVVLVVVELVVVVVDKPVVLPHRQANPRHTRTRHALMAWCTQLPHGGGGFPPNRSCPPVRSLRHCAPRVTVFTP